MPDEDQLILRNTTFGDGHVYPNDWQVFWRGLPVGRILKQPGVSFGRPNWWWGVNFDQRPQPADNKGVCCDLEECKRRFKVAWSCVRSEITEDDIATFRRHLAESTKRAKWHGTRSTERH